MSQKKKKRYQSNKQETSKNKKQTKSDRIWTGFLIAVCIGIVVLAILAIIPKKEPLVQARKFDELGENQYYFATIEVAEYGTIKVQLDHTKAPITVDNFVNLVNANFYEGLTFHRIIEGFMMQGGRTSIPEKVPEPIVGEFTSNGYKYNTISHQRGVISMARSGNNPNSASTQFFIMHHTNTNLDGNYAAFGYVVEGMDVVDKICSEAEPTDDNGSISLMDQPLIESITLTIETVS